MKVTLTFDNGPEPSATPHVLDVLHRSGIKATFFVVGKQLLDTAGAALMRKAHSQGHWIGNHTFHHLVPFGLNENPEAAPAEIARTQDLIGKVQHPDKLFRPFGGGGNLDSRLLDGGAVDYLVANQFTCVLWNAVPRDWEDPVNWVDTALEQCEHLEWALLVLHDLPTGAMDRLEEFILEVTRRGGSFTQAFPESCVPIKRGLVRHSIEEFIGGAPE